MHLRISSSLNLRVLGIVTFCLLALMIGMSLSIYRQSAKSSDGEIDQRISIIEERLGHELLLPVWNVEIAEIDTILKIEMKDPIVAGIFFAEEPKVAGTLGYLRANDGRLVPLAPTLLADLARSSYRLVTIPIEREGTVLGNLSLFFTDAPMLRTLNGELFDMLWQSLLITVAVMLVVLLYFRRSVLAPIVALTRTVERFGRGDLRARSDPGRQDEIGTLARGFNRMADEISEAASRLEEMVKNRTAQLVEAEKFAFLGSLVAGVAHEINTPLGIGITAITHQNAEAKRIARLLAEGGLMKSDLEKFIEALIESSSIVEANLNRAGNFVQSFKMIAVDQSTEDRRLFLVGEYLEEVVFAMRPRLKKTRHEVRIECDPALEVEGYPGGISQILTNLIMNSLVHGLDPAVRGTICIKAGIERDGAGKATLAMIYTDDGKGISRENLPKIFTPFFTTLKGSGGTGLGLYIIHRTAASLGGEVVCHSEPGKGVRFSVRLPVDVPLVGAEHA